MFKRLNKASALRAQLDEEEEDDAPVSLEAALDEDSASDSDLQDSDEDEDDSDDDDDDEDEEESEDGAFTVAQALQSPIYVDDESNSHVQLFRCVACPIVHLKNEKSIEVHLESKNHKRRYARFVAFAESEKKKEGNKVLYIDPRTLIDLLEDERAKAMQATASASKKRKTVHEDATQETYVPRLERRKMRRAARREKRAALQKPSSS
ncbi:hypothetical protein ACI68E_000186 [Malassezia pachydermatis]